MEEHMNDIIESEPEIKSIKAPIPNKVFKDSWLNRNIQSILAIFLLVFSFMFFWYVLRFDLAQQSSLKDIVILLIGIVSTLVTTVISYFFGSSQGSKDKTNLNRRI